MTTTKRKMLLIVRAGDSSLHETWLEGKSGLPRNWDLHISYFGNDQQPFGHMPADVSLTFERGPKFKGLAQCLDKVSTRLDQYDYIGFPDDDLKADCATWNRFADIIDRHRPMLAQPALSLRSFYSYEELIQRPDLSLRWTNFVEVMCPVFSREALGVALPYFSEGESGWGMDSLWPHLFSYERQTLCVVDETPVLHTRAIGVGSLYRMLAESEVSPIQEKVAFLSRHGIQSTGIRVLAALDNEGRLIVRYVGNKRIIPRVRQMLRRHLHITNVR
jgi:hypothetical protein